MNRYWDLSEKQRAELSQEEVAAFLTVELMEKGVVKVEEPEYLPVEEIPGPDLVVYRLKAGWRKSEIAYLSAEEAANASKNAVVLADHYASGNTTNHVSEDKEIEIEPQKVYSLDSFTRNKVMIDRNKAAEASNKQLRDDYATAIRAQDDAMNGLWDDWNECRGKDRVNKRVVETYNQYLKNCKGQADIAFVFLSKAYTVEQIREAFAWCGIPSPVFPDPPEAVALQVAGVPGDDF